MRGLPQAGKPSHDRDAAPLALRAHEARRSCWISASFVTREQRIFAQGPGAAGFGGPGSQCRDQWLRRAALFNPGRVRRLQLEDQAMADAV